MVIEFKTNNKNFKELSNGAVFGFRGNFFIKMAYNLREEDKYFNAVNIEDGFPTFFDDDDNEIIEYPKAKTVIE